VLSYPRLGAMTTWAGARTLTTSLAHFILTQDYSTTARQNQDRTCVLWAGLALGHGDLTTMVVIVHPTLKSSPIGELLPTTERGVAVEKFHQWWNFCKRPSGALMPIGIVRPTRAGASRIKSFLRRKDRFPHAGGGVTRQILYPGTRFMFPPRGRGRHDFGTSPPGAGESERTGARGAAELRRGGAPPAHQRAAGNAR